MSMLNNFVSIFGWCSLQSKRVVSVDNLLVILEDPEDHREVGKWMMRKLVSVMWFMSVQSILFVVL